MTTLGINMEIDDNMDTVLEKIKAAPIVQSLRRAYGPNWFDRREELNRLSGDSLVNSHVCIPMDKFRPSVLKLAAAIIHHWEILRNMKNEGKLNHFEAKWARLRSSRSMWLQQQYPELPSYPHTDIYEWVKSSESELRSLNKEYFLISLLDTENLSQDDVFPNFLKARASFHPRLFRTIDGRSVTLGMFCGSLK
jgi:hypothetical protein